MPTEAEHRAERLRRDRAAWERFAGSTPPELSGDEASPLSPADQGVIDARMQDLLASPLAKYLDAARDFVCRYVAFSSEHEPVAVVLWVAHSWVVERCEVSPILGVTSAEKRSGKTRLFDCLELLVPHPERMVTPSAAVVYTLLAGRPRPTLLLDEVDAIFGKRKQAENHEDLRAVLNAGNRQGTTVPRVRMDGNRREVERLDVFGAKAVAGIGELPDTVADRCIPIRLKRRARHEPVARFRRRSAEREAGGIETPDWERVPLVPEVPDVPEGIGDRAMDSWEPLIALADEAGGMWPVLARTASAALSAEDEGQVTNGIRLLSDIRDAFGEAESMTTANLLEALNARDDAPWGDWYGSPLSARGLGRLLDPYGIEPRQRRSAGSKLRGYWRLDLEDAWARYCPVPTETSGTSGTPGTDEPVDAGGEAAPSAEGPVLEAAEDIFADMLEPVVGDPQLEDWMRAPLPTREGIPWEQ